MKILEELTKKKTHFSFARNREKGGKIENKVKLIATFLNDNFQQKLFMLPIEKV